MMKTIMVDKIASVAQACDLSHELRISTDIPSEEGVVLAVEILTNKANYNALELTSGRMAKISRGDVVVGALGHVDTAVDDAPAQRADGETVHRQHGAAVVQRDADREVAAHLDSRRSID